MMRPQEPAERAMASSGKQPRTVSEDKKLRHRQSELKRRERINNGLAALRMHTGDVKSADQATVMENATKSIKGLLEEISLAERSLLNGPSSAEASSLSDSLDLPNCEDVSTSLMPRYSMDGFDEWCLSLAKYSSEKAQQQVARYHCKDVMRLDDYPLHNDVGMYIMSNHGIFLDCNEALCRIFRKSRSEIVSYVAPQLGVFVSCGKFAPYIYQVIRCHANHLTFEEQISVKDFLGHSTTWIRHTIQARGAICQDELGPQVMYALGVIQPMSIPPFAGTRVVDYDGCSPELMPHLAEMTPTQQHVVHCIKAN